MRHPDAHNDPSPAEANALYSPALHAKVVSLMRDAMRKAEALAAAERLDRNAESERLAEAA